MSLRSGGGPPPPLEEQFNAILRDTKDAGTAAAGLDLLWDVLEKAYCGLQDALNPANPDPPIIGRDQQAKEIRSFATYAATPASRMRGTASNLLYIYGPPGVGKTTVVQHVVNEVTAGAEQDVYVKTMNGMHLTTPLDFFVQMWRGVQECVCREELVDDGPVKPDTALFYLRSVLTRQGKHEAAVREKSMAPGRSRSKSVRAQSNVRGGAAGGVGAGPIPPAPMTRKLLIILDEMDAAIGSSGSSVLFDLMDLLAQSGMVYFIGIANRPQLFESFRFASEHTQRIESRTERYQQMHFKAYGIDALCSILAARVKKVCVSKMINASNTVARTGTLKYNTITVMGSDLTNNMAMRLAAMSAFKHASGDCRQALHLMTFAVAQKQQQLGLDSHRAHGGLAKKYFRDKQYILQTKEIQEYSKTFFTTAQQPHLLTDEECLVLCIIADEVTKITHAHQPLPIRKELVVQRYQVHRPQIKQDKESLVKVDVADDMRNTMYQVFCPSIGVYGNQVDVNDSDEEEFELLDATVMAAPAAVHAVSGRMQLVLAAECADVLNGLALGGYVDDQGATVSLSSKIINDLIKVCDSRVKDLDFVRRLLQAQEVDNQKY